MTPATRKRGGGMTLEDILDALGELTNDARVTISVRKADLVKALEQRETGPLIMTTTQAADAFGYNSERWRRWAQAGEIRGAFQGREKGTWRLPRAACEQHIADLERRGAKPQSSSVVPLHSQLRRPRGPRKQQAAAKAASAQ